LGCLKLTYHKEPVLKVISSKKELTSKKSASNLRSAYRYGYGSKEKDDEISGEGNMLDYGARFYNSRLARFLSLDPLTFYYPELSPYEYASNRPIVATDYNGLQAWDGPNNYKDVMSLESWRQYVNKKVVQAVNNKEVQAMNMDCANFQIWLVIEYFKMKGVHIQIPSYNGKIIYDSSDEKWKDNYDGFVEEVRTHTTAESLKSMMDEISDPNDLARGDLFNYGYHLAMFWSLINDDAHSVAQGSGHYYGKDDPDNSTTPLVVDYERGFGIPFEEGEDGYSLMYRWSFLNEVPKKSQLMVDKVTPRPAKSITYNIEINQPVSVPMSTPETKTNKKGGLFKRGKSGNNKSSSNNKSKNPRFL